AYDVRGEGREVLVLLHGFTGNRETWSRVEPHLVDRFRLIRVDLPGHGGSPPPAAPGLVGFMETVRALEAILDEAGVARAHVAGYSQGARVALGVAMEAPARIERLVMESGTAGLHRRKDRAERRRADERLADEILTGGVDAFVRRWELLPLFAGLRRLPSADQQAIRTRRSSASAEGLAGALRALGLGVQPDYWTRLWKLRVPTLLLTGAEDTKFTALARRMAAELPIVWSCAFEGVGHAPHLEAPEAWAREVIDFLETPWFETPAWSIG
ncbi:MAG TPA: 2-succinyl-6-hydroxy-2,4-cyclohexadiene-1-carboxylate synthase, partial [Myxococcaceae bacterium]|nr:2-succinyl-6-hydroxy-2,4-cyclohexadiene-1-carboxylate synthase [Myxococcaceae bacterium]